MAMKVKFFAMFLANVAILSAFGRPAETEVDGKADDDLVPVTLEDIYSGYYSATGFNGSWISSNEIMYRDGATRDIYKFNMETLESSVFLNASILSNWNGTSYSISADGNYVLIGHSSVSGFRHSVWTKYVVYDIAEGTYSEIAGGENLPLATWAPVGNGLGYVFDNDVYYGQISETGVTGRRLTFDGESGVVYNGVPDWVYEEEVFGSGSALWFSPDGRRMVIASFNDKNVSETLYYFYGEPGDLEDQYPEQVSIKYPKAGTTNPSVQLSLIDLTDTSSPSRIDLPAPEDVVGEDHVIYTVSWFSNYEVVATWTNRVQNVSQSVLYNSVTGIPSYILEIRETAGWVEVPTPIYHNASSSVLLLKSQDSGTSAGAFTHLTRFARNGPVLENETDLSPGRHAVTSLIGIDDINQRIYFLATGDGQPSERNLYYVPINADGSESPICVSCNFETPERNTCKYAAASFSTDRSYYVLTCSGPDPATVRIYNSTDHSQIYSWQENLPLRERISRVLKPINKYITVNVNGYDAKVKLRLPPHLDENDTDTKYPMLVETYGGPNSLRVTDAGSYSFYNYMSTNRNVIWANIDGRGSAYKGNNMLFEIYRKLGTVEIQDQIDVTRRLQETYGWIDAERTAIWGWSYGGFASTMVLATDHDSVFKCGIAVAPVSSWIYYDTIYTERYMGLPKETDNLEGYIASNATGLVEGIRGKKYMLIHGTADDNVHYQQAMALGRALAAADIEFEQVSYTDQAHSLSDVSPHLYHTMDKFWGKCFELESIY